MSNKVIAVLRDKRYCPKGIQVDADILEAVAERIKVDTFINEAQLTPNHLTPNTSLVLSMGRLPETIAMLKTSQANGAIVVNAPSAVEICTHRTRLHQVMQACGVALPPEQGAQSWWLKRGDAAAQDKSDVQFAANQTELNEKIAAFQQRGITAYTVSAHVSGDLVKFYGVAGTGFFRYYYPTDDGDTKFNDELRNGTARHYPFVVEALQADAEKLAQAVGISVYGGDCIIREDGSYCVIDFNDWPSFSRCRQDAAIAIAALIEDCKIV